ncbi:MAG TPA: hypothetical protein VG795_03095 [Acidimicrobiia bacterium]|nr:hypothetical protein [Acidimicrobiia bacterium]
MVEIWMPLVVVGLALAAFVAAITRKGPRTLGGIGGFVGGVGVFLPLGCATSSDPVSQTVCHTAVGIPMPEEIGMVAGLALGIVLGVVAICLPGEEVTD